MRLFKRRHTAEPYWKPEYNLLAVYNAEKARGIQHSKEFEARMVVVQADYNCIYLPAYRDYLDS